MSFSAWFLRVAAAVPFICACSGPPIPQSATGTLLTMNRNAASPFTISSTTFKNNHFVPASMVYDHSGCSGPPPGKVHHYVFTVYALDTMLKLPRSAYAENLDLAIRGHILGSASITGLYKT